ncbi:protein kinase-like domain, concanavalin A-like lectin/glucanase domain protein [Tanacetum coccineum]
MAFGGNTRDLGSFGEEMDEITDLHQILEEVLLTERGDDVAGIKRHRRDPSSDGVRDLVTASGRSRKPAFVCIAVDTSRETRVRRKDTIGEFLDPKEKRKIESWLEDSRIVDSLDREIMNKGLESRQKPSNPSKNNNFIGRVRGLKVFIGNFTYECNFMILEDTTSIIDHHLGEVVFGKPFARKTGLVYDQEEGTVTFEKDNEKITFKMPHKMEAFNHIDFKDVNTDSIPPFVLENNDDRGKTYYSDSLTLGPEYREDESISKEIRHLMKLEREAKRHKGEVTSGAPQKCFKFLQRASRESLLHVELMESKEVTTIFTDSNQFRNGINVLGNELTKKRCRLSGKAPLPVDRKLTREIIKDRLTKVMSMESRVILVHTYFNTGLMIFEIAKSLGTMKRGYVWIATAWLSAVLDSIGIPHKNTGTLHGVLTLRPHTPDSYRKKAFARRWKNLSNESIGLNPYGLYAYDTVWIIAHAIDNDDEDLHSPMDEVDPFIFFMDTAKGKLHMKFNTHKVLSFFSISQAIALATCSYYEGLQKCFGLDSETGQYSSEEIDKLDALYKSLGKQYTWSSAVKAPGTQKSKQDAQTKGRPRSSKQDRISHYTLCRADIEQFVLLMPANLRIVGFLYAYLCLKLAWNSMKFRKAHLLEDKQIPSVGVFDEGFSTWMAFGGNTRDLGSFREETDEITDLHQILEEVLLTERGDGVAGIKRRHRDPSSDGIRDLETASGCSRLNEDLESST